MFDFLQRDSLRLRYHELYPDELQHHHEGEESKDCAGVEPFDHGGEEQRQQHRENPVSEAAERLSLGPVVVRKSCGAFLR